MQAMILAAGRGERMLPLTENTPKPLLKVNGKPLIQHQIERLVNAGYTNIVINHGPMGDQIENFIGDGTGFNAKICYSAEHDNLLDTGGGIFKALTLLGSDPFLVVNADVWTNYPFSNLPDNLPGLAHLVLVDNPPQHRQGDFALLNGRVHQTGERMLTFSGIGVYRPELFEGCSTGPFPLAPLLCNAMQHEQVTGEYFQGLWSDIGTPDRLKQLQAG